MHAIVPGRSGVSTDDGPWVKNLAENEAPDPSLSTQRWQPAHRHLLTLPCRLAVMQGRLWRGSNGKTAAYQAHRQALDLERLSGLDNEGLEVGIFGL